jgi:hypothetical protein
MNRKLGNGYWDLAAARLELGYWDIGYWVLGYWGTGKKIN